MSDETTIHQDSGTDLNTKIATLAKEIYCSLAQTTPGAGACKTATCALATPTSDKACEACLRLLEIKKEAYHRAEVWYTTIKLKQTTRNVPGTVMPANPKRLREVEERERENSRPTSL